MDLFRFLVVTFWFYSKSSTTHSCYFFAHKTALKMSDIRTSSLQSPIDVAEYLSTRLHQIGVRSIHGVPGDYNLMAIDYIDKVGLRWVGNLNELNAGKYESLWQTNSICLSLLWTWHLAFQLFFKTVIPVS